MRSLLFKLFRAVIVLGVLLVTLAIGVGWFFGDQLLARYKPRIETILSKRTGYDVSYGGASIKLFPFIGFVLTDGELRPPADCVPWRIGSLNLKVELLPLLLARIEVRHVEVDGAEGVLRVGAGQPSFVDNKGERCGTSSPVSESETISTRQSTTATQAEDPDSPISIAFDDLKIRSARFRIFADKAEHDLRISDAAAELQLNEDSIALPRFEVKGTFNSTPVAVEVQGLQTAARNTRFELKSGTVLLGRQKLTVSGEFDRGTSTGEAILGLHEISLGEIRSLIGPFIPQMAGRFESDLQVKVTGNDLHVSGRAELLEASTSIGGPFALKSLVASGVDLALKGATLESMRTNLSLRGFSAVNDGASYKADSVEGAIAISGSSDIQIGGELRVQNFGYADSDTVVERAVADLNEISGRVSASGDVVFHTKLDATDVHVKTSGFEVSSVERVTAPVEVKVPSRGGYFVTGPVAITNGELTLSGKKLDKASGTVAMYVASPLKDFQTEKISAESYGEKLQTSAHFAMTREDYKIDKTTAQIAGGTITGQFSMGRRGEKPLSVEAKIDDLPVPAAYQAAMQQKDSPVKGTVQSLAMKVSGNRSNLPGSLAGSGSILVSGALFQTIDIQKLVKEAIAAIPLVGTDLVPSSAPQDLQAGSISSNFLLGEGRVTAPNLKIQLSNLTIESNLQVGFDSTLNGTASLVVLEDTFRLFGFGFDRLGNFLAREGRIAVPLLIGRTITDPSVRPNIKEIARTFTGINLIESVAGEAEEVGEDVVDAGEDVAQEVENQL